MIGYIYIITNLITKKQYIGQTRRSIEIRYQQHLRESQNDNDCMYIHRAIKKYGQSNFEVKEIASVTCDSLKELKDQLNYLEMFYIAEYNTLSPNGYNLTKGGAECAESIKRQVDEYGLDGNFIQTHESLISVADKLGVSTSTAIFKCCSGKSKFAFQRIWRYHGDSLDKYELPDLNIASRSYKLAPVDQYSKDGVFIKNFNSIAEACQHLGKDNTSHISECCEGKLYTAFDFIWRYKGESFDKYNQNDKRFVGCEKYNLDGKLVDTYSSIGDACFSIGKDAKKAAPNIVNCCLGKKKTAYGFIWKYT